MEEPLGLGDTELYSIFFGVVRLFLVADFGGVLSGPMPTSILTIDSRLGSGYFCSASSY